MTELAIQPPLRGISEGSPFTGADPRYAIAATNIRVWDVQEHRVRLSTRNGISALWDLDSGNRAASAPFQFIECARVLRSGSQVEVTILVHRGTVYASIGTGNPAAISGGPHLATSGTVAGFHLFGVMYLTDGASYKKVDMTAGSLSVASWTPTSGSLPADGSNKPTLACRFGARACFAGIASAPNNWFLSKINDPSGWSTDPEDLTLALDGNSTAGLIKK